MRCIAAISVLFALAAGHSSAQGPSMTGTIEIVGKVAVTRTGAIFYNGAPTTLEKLREQLLQLRQAKGVV